MNEVAEKLADRGHKVPPLCPKGAEDLDVHKIRWQKVPGPGWPEVAKLLDLSREGQPSNSGAILRYHTQYRLQHLAGECDTIQNIQPAKKKILDRLGSLEKISTAPQIDERALL